MPQDKANWTEQVNQNQSRDLTSKATRLIENLRTAAYNYDLKACNEAIRLANEFAEKQPLSFRNYMYSMIKDILHHAANPWKELADTSYTKYRESLSPKDTELER